MSNSLINPPFPFERNHIRSGPIERDGFSDYGVIFSARENGSVNDFHPADLTGATLEVTELRDSGEPNRFFTILGGYYCERNPGGRQDEVAISHIFGIASDPSLGFGLLPGDHCLADEWTMKDLSGPPASNMMDERDKGEDGWTFIVNYKPFRHQYPFSGKPMEIFRECPIITSFVLSTESGTETSVTASGVLTVLHGPARAFEIDWGDGSPVETTTSLQVGHTFDKLPGEEKTFLVKVTVVGPDGCNDSVTTPFKVVGPCPVVKIASQQVSYPSASEATATVNLSGHIDGITYTWDWGDGSPLDQSTTPEFSHSYEREGEEKSYTVTIVAKGPGICAATLTTSVLIDAFPCPELLALTAGQGQIQGELFVVPFVAEVSGRQPTEFRWDFGDGQTETTTAAAISHGFALQPGVAADKTVKVTIVGPGSACEDSDTVLVNVPGPCPVVIVHVRPGAVTDTTATVKLEFTAQGAAPESWTIDWKDGSPKETVSAAAVEHVFTRPPGDQETFLVEVTSNGPGSCTDSRTVPVVIPGVCPVLSNLETEWLGVEENFYQIKATLEVSGPAPDSFEWTWEREGVKETTNTTIPEAIHQFAGKPGEAVPVSISVKAIGPDSCESSTSTEATVPPLPCPVLSVLKVIPGPISGDEQAFTFSADFMGPTPGGFRWHWGDGSEEEATDKPQATHTFSLLPGEATTYDVRLFSDGPGSCKGATHALVPVAPFCPLPGQLTAEVQPSEEGRTPVAAEITHSGPDPALYLWDWGDGSAPEETTVSQATHHYVEKYGVEQSFTILATIKGPGVCPDKTKSIEVRIPGPCPVFPKLEVEQLQLGESSVTFEFRLPGNHPADSYVWDPGDGSAPITTQDAKLVHEYPRWAGQTPEFIVSVQAIGPGSCVSGISTTISIPAPDICPVISRIDTYIVQETEATVTFGFIPVSLHGVPTSYVWDFADGSPTLSTTDAEVFHEYQRDAGAKLEVSVVGSGPNNCSTTQSVHISVPTKKACPQPGGLSLLGKDVGKAFDVTASLEILSGTPETYSWDWGDGTRPTVTNLPQASHSYQKKNKDAEKKVTVTVSGPGNCVEEVDAAIVIPAIEVTHPWCKWWKYLVTFLASLAGGGLLVCFADHLDPQPSGWLFWVLLLLILGFGVVSWLWQSLGSKRGCPPALCDGLALGWTMMLTMTAVAFYLNSCLPTWMGWGIGCFIVAAGFAGLWYKRCAKSAGARVFFTYFLIFVLAFALVVLALAMPALACV